MQLVYGVNPLLELIKQGGGGIKEIIVAVGRKGAAIDNILAHASVKGIPVLYKDKSCLDHMSEGSVHQGVAAWCADYVYATIDQVIENKTLANVVLILDGVTDPHNLGALVRTALCLGVKGVIIPENRASAVTATVVKASAGATHWLPIAREVNLCRAMEELQRRGFWIYGADADRGLPLSKFADEGPVGLVMGSEGKGLRPLISKKCDFLLSIPLEGKLASLNVSVAAGIILYEIAKRQKGTM